MDEAISLVMLKMTILENLIVSVDYINKVEKQ